MNKRTKHPGTRPNNLRFFRPQIRGTVFTNNTKFERSADLKKTVTFSVRERTSDSLTGPFTILMSENMSTLEFDAVQKP